MTRSDAKRTISILPVSTAHDRRSESESRFGSAVLTWVDSHVDDRRLTGERSSPTQSTRRTFASCRSKSSASSRALVH